MAKNVKKSSTAKKTTGAKKSPAVQKVDIVDKSVVVQKDTSNVNPEYTDAFIQEVDEDVQNDNLKVLWNRYGVAIIAFVVLAVSAAVSFDQIRLWKIAQNQRNTETYMDAAQPKANLSDNIEALQKISQDDNGIFSDFARLQIANILLSEDKNEEALAMLQTIVDDKQVNSEVKNIALVKLATYKVDTLERNEFEELIKPLLSQNSSWNPIAQDLLAMSAIKNGDIDTAKNIYENILKVKDLPENFRTKIKDVLSSLNEE